jgi:hypothetical protein
LNFEKGDGFVGRVKLGNQNAQRNNNRKKGKISSELVEFTTGQGGEDFVRNRPKDN